MGVPSTKAPHLMTTGGGIAMPLSVSDTHNNLRLAVSHSRCMSIRLSGSDKRFALDGHLERETIAHVKALDGAVAQSAESLKERPNLGSSRIVLF